MKKKILFIINPISGTGKNKSAEKLIRQKLNKDIFDFETEYTARPKHAIELSKQGIQESFDIITAVGGDGSVNEIGSSLVEYGLAGLVPKTLSALAILPCGSGNGTARHLQIPMNLSKAIEIINQQNIKKIDTFSVNNHIAVNTAGIGFAAHIAHEFSRLKKRGFSNYLKISLRDSLKYKSQVCEVEMNGIIQKVRTFIIDIANGTQWGNNAVIAPEAKNDDGLLDLCIVRDFPFQFFPLMAARLFTRSIHRSKFVDITKVREAIIRQEKAYAHIDGEPIITGNELRIKINPLSLNVIAPTD